jgi:NADPH-dependent 7-cyano-7-deazaguanine reductase QueF
MILDDLVNALAPRWCEVVAEFSVRGGIGITVQAEYKTPQTPAGRSLADTDSNPPAVAE